MWTPHRDPLREVTNLPQLPPLIFTTKISDQPVPPKKSRYKSGYYKSVFETRGACEGKKAAASSDSPIVKNWNEEFQKLLAEVGPASSEDEKLANYTKLSHLAQDFVYVAKTYGKIIIQERCLPVSDKTIKPVDLGGLAGGEKYICQGILFKFAVDRYNLYGSDEFSMKAAGHELKGLMGFFKCQVPGLHVPLMTLLDYLGCRLIAMSILPLESLIYGSDDGGETIHTEVAELNEKMRVVAEKLNLKGHMAGMGSQKKLIYGPTDIEGHRGKDGRYYVLDFARVFPPEAPIDPNSREFLFKLFRAEFCRKYSRPLSSDGCSSFGSHEKEIHNSEIVEATVYLHQKVIPRFAQWLEAQNVKPAQLKTLRLSELMHREGINMRHLGMVRANVAAPELKSLLLVECIARIVKNNLRLRFRTKTAEIRIPSLEPYKQEVICYLNLLLSSRSSADAEMEKYWKTELKQLVQKTFASALSEEELRSDFDLRKNVDLSLLLSKIQNYSGVRLAAKSAQELASNPDSWDLVYPDVEKITAKVKHMQIIALAEGTALYIQSCRAKGENSDRLFQMAMQKFEAALSSNPDNFPSLNNWGDALRQQAMKKTGEEREKLVHEAMEKYRAGRNHQSLLELAAALHQQANKASSFDERERLFSLASESFKSAIEFRRNFSEAYFQFGQMQFDRARRCRTDEQMEEVLKQSGENFRSAISCCSDSSTSFAHLQWTTQEKLSAMELAVIVQLSLRNGSFEIVDPTSVGCQRVCNDSVLHAIHSASQSKIRTMILTACPKISHLGLSVPANRMMTSSSAYQCLRHLSLSDLPSQFSAESVIALLEICSLTLETLELRGYRFAEVLRHHSSSASAALASSTQNSKENSSGGSPTKKKSSPTARAFASVSHSLTLSSLRHLDLSESQISDEGLGDLLSRCTNSALQQLSLSGCSALSNSGILKICQYVNSLVELDLSRCKQLSDEMIAAIASSNPNLAILRLNGCDKITKLGICSVAQHCGKFLQTITLADCQKVTDEAITSFATHCRQLSVIDLTKCKLLTDESLIVLSKSGSASQLRAISVSGCVQLGNSALRSLLEVANSSLQHLKLSGLYKVDEDIMTSITSLCPTLQTLHLASCEKVPATSLTKLTNLRSLDLYDCKLMDDLTLSRAFKSLTQLRKVILSNCKGVRDLAIESLAMNCTSLQTLALGYIPQLKKETIQLLAKNCHLLTSIDLHSCKYLPEEALLSLADHCPLLESVDFTGCNKITDALLVSLAANCPQLKALRVEDCTKITDVGVGRVAESHRLLQILRLKGCFKLTDGAVAKISKMSSHLHTITLGGCSQLSDSALLQLVKGCSNLNRLSVDACKLITRQTLVDVKKQYPQIDISCKF